MPRVGVPAELALTVECHNISPKAGGSLKTVCLNLPSPVTVNSAKKRSRHSARIEAGRNGAPTVVRFAGRWSGFWKMEGNGFQNSIGPR